MATNDPKVNYARVLNMFITIRNSEQKNVRTLQYDSKDMVKRITNYIVKQSDDAASDSKEAEDE
ncbi:MAG: hypothetical protein ACI3W5_14190 [Faecousia sp.]